MLTHFLSSDTDKYKGVFIVALLKSGFSGGDLFCITIMARPEGFEPPAFRIGICCDIQLRHGRSML